MTRPGGRGSARTRGGRVVLGLVILAHLACAPSADRDEASPANAELVLHDTISGLDVTVRPLESDSAIVPAAVVAAAVAAGSAPSPGATAGALPGAPPGRSPNPTPAAPPIVAAPAIVAAPDAARPAGERLADATPAELAQLGAGMIIPVKGVAPAALHDNFAERRGGGTRAHEALDILAPRGTPVLAAVDGRVLKLHQSAAGGLMIYTADASDRFILMYAHLDQYAPGLADGAPLRKGQQIATVGSTGNAPPGSPHLHFAIARGTPSRQWWRGEPANPYPLLVH